MGFASDLKVLVGDAASREIVSNVNKRTRPIIGVTRELKASGLSGGNPFGFSGLLRALHSRVMKKGSWVAS